ncbi:MAG: HupE/UreJ family protein [Methylophilaceae bacterium]|nr:HupE/UreJ family protein [Methylophilaceae bacterium]
MYNTAAYAHKPSDSYLIMQVKDGAINGQWDIALRDLDYAIGLDENANSEITWQEVLNKQKEIKAYAFARLSIDTNLPIKNYQTICDITPKQILIDHHTDGAYAVIKFASDCKAAINNLDVNYTLFADIDPSHRGLLRLEFKGATKTAIFGPDNARQNFILIKPSRFTEFKDYIVEGIWHIWKGYDHILFLISLLLPAVLIRTANTWQPSHNFKFTFIDVLKVVTAFTLAHSITLTLATLHVVTLPSRWVEATIAASIVTAALNNIYPGILKRRWLAAFVFGLVHGFGFAAVLSDLGLQGGALMIALVGFNVGVEIGQLGILSIFLPGAFMMRNTWFYQRLIFYVGSILIMVIACLWFIERAFNMKIFTLIPLIG